MSEEDKINEIIAERELERVFEIDWTEIEGLDHSCSQYSVEQKIACLTAFVITGSLKKAAAQIGIKYGTVRNWASQTEWWKQGLDKIRKRKNDELDARITLSIEKAMEEVDDRLQNGDVVLSKLGEPVRKPLGGRELVTMLGILYDKRALMRGDPTSHTVKTSPTSVLESLKGEFEKISKDLQDKTLQEKQINSIEGEIIDGKS